MEIVTLGKLSVGKINCDIYDLVSENVLNTDWRNFRFLICHVCASMRPSCSEIDENSEQVQSDATEAL